MRECCLASLIAILLIGESSALAQSTPPEKDFLFEAAEGAAAELTKYALEGYFDAKRPFGLEIALEGEHWAIKFRHAGTAARVFTLPSKKYRSLQLERVVVVTRSRAPTDPGILVVIPFGEPQTDCFLNGDQVFRKVILFYEADKLASVEERVFKDCKPEWQELPLDASPKG